MVFPEYSQSAPWYSHSIPIVLPDYSHGGPTLFMIQYYHSIPMVFPILFSYYSHNNPLMFPCHSHAVPGVFPEHSRRVPIVLPCPETESILNILVWVYQKKLSQKYLKIQNSRPIPTIFPCPEAQSSLRILTRRYPENHKKDVKIPPKIDET